MSAARSTVDQLMAEAFGRPRDPRSDAYKAGVRAVICHRIERVRFKDPYPLGSAEGDAFQLGNQEGQRIWRQWQETQRNATAVFVHGPQGCGKTTHGAALAAFYGKRCALDLDDLRGQEAPADALILCNEPTATSIPFEAAIRAAGLHDQFDQWRSRKLLSDAAPSLAEENQRLGLEIAACRDL